MARRQRSLPKDKVLKRSVSLKKPKLKIFAFCEGKKTEPEYLKSFCSEYGNGLVNIVIVGAVGSPKTIIEKASDKKKMLTKEYKKSNNSFDSLFEVWAVYDIDEHPKLVEAKDMADANKVFTAISNPCFEIWPLWHLMDYTKSIHRHDLQGLLTKEIPEYDKKNKTFSFAHLKTRYNDAKSRATKMEKTNLAVGSAGANPSSNIYELLDKIIINGKKT